MSAYNLPSSVVSSGLVRVPDGTDAKLLLRLMGDQRAYRYQHSDDFRMLPRDLSTFELDDTSLSNLEATAETAIIANKAWGISGTGATNTTVAFSSRGGITVSTVDAINNATIIRPATETGFVGPLASIVWTFAKQPSIRAFMSRVPLTSETASAYSILIGFNDTLTGSGLGSEGTDAAVLRLMFTGAAASKTLSHAEFQTAVSGADKTEDVRGITDAVWGPNKAVAITVRINGNRKAEVLVNNAVVFESAVQLGSFSASVMPFVAIRQDNDAGAAPMFHYHGVDVEQNYV